jgi:hypothetical protein
MSKTDIDKIFRDKFHGHENSSNVYTPDRWKAFEKQLDKNLPADKKGSFRFSLNNLLIFISCLVIVVMVPLLLLQSKGVDNSSTISERAILTHKNIISDKGAINKNLNDKRFDHTVISPPAKTIAAAQVADIAKEKNTQADANSSKQLSQITKPEKADALINKPEQKEIDKINPILSSTNVVEKEASTVVEKNTAVKSDTNSKKKDDKTQTGKKNKKPGRYKRSSILVPRVEYNGL